MGAPHRPDEVGLAGEHAGSLPTVDLDHAHRQTQDRTHQAHWLEQVRVVGDHHCGFVLAQESADEEVCVIADYLGKPTRSDRYFEAELASCTGQAQPSPGRVFNACMLDSSSSLAIQIVDLILGGIRHSFLADREPGARRDAEKDAVSIRIREHVERRTLSESFTNDRPRYFSVWELAP